MSLPNYNNNKRYNYEGFEQFLKEHDGDGMIYELINGVIYSQATPILEHQDIELFISSEIKQYLKGKPCKVYTNTTVYLSEQEINDTTNCIRVIPDVIVVCDKHKRRKTCIKGSPDMVVEVLSPSSIKKDRTKNLINFMKYGVKEYWIVDPDEKTVEVFTFANNNINTSNEYTYNDIVPIGIFDGFSIDFSEFVVEEYED